MSYSTGKSIALALELSFQIIVALAFPILLGVFIDSKLSINPWGTIIGTLLAIVCAFVILFRYGVKMNGK